MHPHGVEILLVEDNASDAELTLRAGKSVTLVPLPGGAET